MNIMATNKNWLYELNKTFATKNQRKFIINYPEIVDTLMHQKKLSNSLTQRLLMGILVYIILLSNIYGLVYFLQDMFTSHSDLASSIFKAIVILFLYLGIHYFSTILVKIIIYYPYELEKDIKNLLDRGVLLEGEITTIRKKDVYKKILEYKFYNTNGELITGTYFLRGFFHNSTSDVKVLYFNDSLHTLL